MYPQSTYTSTEPIRILMVTPRFFPDMGGVENHVYEVTKRLANSGAEVTVLTTDRLGSLPSHEIQNGVQIERVRAWPTQKDYFFAPGLVRYIQQRKWHLVHIQSYHTLVAPLAMFAAMRAKLPYLLTFHGGGHSVHIRNAMRGTQLALLRPLLAYAVRLVATARFEEKYYNDQLHLPVERFVLIPNGADLPQPAHPVNQPQDGTWIASVGRLEHYKGHQRILEAMPSILKDKPDARLWIAGNGPYESVLRDMAKKLGVEQYVRIQGIPPDDRARMAQELAATSLVVLLSEYETHPIAILEALSLGRPALVANTSGMSELCEQGLATGIPLDSTPNQIATAVLEQLRNPLIPWQIKLPSWDDCAQGLLNLYQEIIGEQIENTDASSIRSTHYWWRRAVRHQSQP